MRNFKNHPQKWGQTMLKRYFQSLHQGVLLITACTLTSVAAQAKVSKAELHFRCQTGMPTTTFEARVEGENLVLTTIHHNGVEFMPIHEGIVVPHDFTYLKGVANVLTQMGDSNEFRFPLKKCTVDGTHQLTCVGGSTQDFNGQKMRAMTLYTSRIRESAFGQNFDQIRVNLTVQIYDFAPVQDVMMRYDPSECDMNF